MSVEPSFSQTQLHIWSWEINLAMTDRFNIIIVPPQHFQGGVKLILMISLSRYSRTVAMN